MSYIDYPIKCSACGLHYTVHSWNEDWHQNAAGQGRSLTGGGFCPECGAKGAKMIWASVPKNEHDDQIFNVVGHTSLVEMTPLIQAGIGHGAPTIARLAEGLWGKDEDA
jgi:hypothetical protein